MGDVIDINRSKNEQKPTVSGHAKCLQCHHEWIAVSPAGENYFQCPQCGTNKGVFRGPCMPENGYFWNCHCGNDLFLLTPTGDMCVLCGTYAIRP